MKPLRIQRKRQKGWQQPRNTVYVGRPGKWGNPYVVSPEIREGGVVIPAIISVEHSLQLYRENLQRKIDANPDYLEPLRGKHLACWCAADQPCHADILLELANEESA